MSAYAHDIYSESIVQAAFMWQVMMIAMMTPVIVPWVRAAAVFADASSDSANRWRPVVTFAGGYFMMWTVYSMIAGSMQVVLRGTNLLGEGSALDRPMAAGVFIAAGLFQFSPIKRACLKHCRNPLTYFLARWRNGAVSLFRLGMLHGAYCVACCWALMATAFALGVMNLAWMALLTLVACGEQIAPRGELIAALVGTGLAGWGLGLIVVNLLIR